MIKLTCAAIAAALCLSLPAHAQPAAPQDAIVTVYRAAPGHQLALLKWLEQQERVAAAAGVPPMRLYVHQSGDSWDYLQIAPVTTPAQDDALKAAAERLGIPSGPAASLELRKHISSHADTTVVGPIGVADYLRLIGQ